MDSTFYGELRQTLDPNAKLFLPTTDGYSQAKRIWNGMFDNHNPALIVQVTNVADVQAVLKFAHQQGLTVTARGGGHSFSGLSTIQNGIVIDFIQMKSITVNPEKKEVFVQPGALLGDLDRETQAFGLATPTGVVSLTGVFGLVLGGGIGWLSRKLGASVDNILSANVILANGEYVTASADENLDLFWALRGCASNFGIVTSLVLKAHSIGLCYRGDYCYPLSQIREILFGVNTYLRTAPSEFGCEVFAEGFSGGNQDKYLRLVYTFYLPAGEAEKMAEPLTKLGSPVEKSWIWITHLKNQSMFDEKFMEHRKYYAKSSSITCDEITNDFVDSIVESVNSATTTPDSLVELVALGGIMKETSAEETSYFHLRKQDWLVNIITSWSEGPGDEHIKWCRDTYKKLDIKSRAVYLNSIIIESSMDTSYQQQLNNTFGSNLDRLASIKKKYDPFNFFRHNLNLLPTNDTKDRF